MRVWALSVVLAIGAFLLVVVGVRPLSRPAGTAPGLPWAALAAAMFLVECFEVDLRVRRERHTFSFHEVVLVIGLVTVDPIGIVIAQLVGAVPALIFVRRNAPMKLVFNTITFGVTAALDVVVFRALGGAASMDAAAVLAAFSATTVTALVGLALTQSVISVFTGMNRFGDFARLSVPILIATAANTSIGIAAVVLLERSPWMPLLLFPPAAVLLGAYRIYLHEREQRDQLEFLYRAARTLMASAEVERGVVALLEQARETFRCDVAEVIVTSANEGERPLRTRVGPGDAVVVGDLDLAENDSLSKVAESEPTTILLRRAGLSGSLEARGLHDAMIVALRAEVGVLGTLLVGRTIAQTAMFTAEDGRVLEILAGQLAAALERDALERRLKRQAFEDALTGLANRALFQDRVAHALRSRRGASDRIAVLFIDLDDFKDVNDSLGHVAGDQLLVSIGQRLRASVGGADTAARLGGDEFAVLLESVADEADALACAELVLAALCPPLMCAGAEVSVRASIGVVTARPGSARTEELLAQADVAMYRAKNRGKARVELFEQSMQQLVTERHELRRAIEAAVDAGGVVVEYQPLVDLISGRTVGAEALARLQLPDRRLPPGVFIPLAEESSLIVRIGDAVLRDACVKAELWSRGLPHEAAPIVSVNVAGRQLCEPDFVDQVAAILSDTGIRPDLIMIEVTETVMLDGADEAVRALGALKQLGVLLALDDFGTGYSSLSRLQVLPIDILKIAKPFVDELLQPDGGAVAEAIVSMATTLRLRVIAEGIEQPEQRDALQRLRCHVGQGYLLGRPVDASLVTARLADEADLGPTAAMRHPLRPQLQQVAARRGGGGA